jgi:hypothetical protein
MRDLGRRVSMLALGIVLWAAPARAADITGSWSLCVSGGVGLFGCQPFAASLVAAGNAFTITITTPEACTIQGTFDPMTNTLTAPAGQCNTELLSFSATATDTLISGSMQFIGCSAHSVTGIRGCAACDDANDCTVDGCAATTCSQPASSCTYSILPAGTTCVDADACTSGGTCTANGVCSGLQMGCNDGNQCTDDACDSQTGQCVFTPNTSPCSDGTLCTAGDTCSGGTCVGGPALQCDPCETCRPLSGCVLAPKTGCRRSLGSAKSKITLKDAPDDVKDKVAWTWGAGEATTPADFGDPPAGDDYRLCIFDGLASSPRRLATSLAPGGGSCAGGGSCWRARGSPPGTSGFLYKDTGLLLPDGVKRVVLKPGDDGLAKAVVKGQGSHLALPSPMNVTLPVTVQLQAENGECFEATFVTARTSREDLFRATSSPSGAFVERGR